MKKKLKQLALSCAAACMLFSVGAVTSACDGITDWIPGFGPSSEQPAPAATYTITYDTGVQGLTIPAHEAEAGAKITPPTDPAREGYRFVGWELNGKAYTFNVMPATDITLTASWQKLYTLSFDGGTGEEKTTASLAMGEEISFPKLADRAGYRFDGWTLNGEAFSGTTMPAGDISLTAKWTRVYMITFNTGSVNTKVDPIVAEAGEKISAPDADCMGWHVTAWLYNGQEYDFSKMPAEDITLTAQWQQLTNLPAMFIELSDANGKELPIDNVVKEYVSSRITLTNVEDDYKLTDLKSTFKGRGNGSWACAKKGWKLKFDKKQSLFGREKNKHWVLIACANFDDPTMSRNYLAYNMASQEFDGIEYTTEARWLDLYVNGEYRGVYLLCEHVRVDKGRIDIDSEYGVEDTGYMVEYDAYASGTEGIDYFKVPGVKYSFSMSSPDPEDFREEGVSEEVYRAQVAYIKDYVTKVYTAALNKDFETFSSLVDVDSFVDMYILHEFFKNVDTGWSSFYMYKKPGGLLYAGPAWDFDATTNIGDRGDRTPQGLYVADQVLSGSYSTSSELFISLYKTEGFLTAVKARWKVLSPKILNFLNERMNDKVYEENRVAMGANYVRWYGKTQEKAETDWVNAMKTLKQWLLDRRTWLDGEWGK